MIENSEEIIEPPPPPEIENIEINPKEFIEEINIPEIQQFDSDGGFTPEIIILENPQENLFYKEGGIFHQNLKGNN